MVINNIHLILFGLILSISFSGFSQTTDEELGYYYYNNNEFDKAVLYLEKVYKKNSSNQNYTYYVNSLIEVGENKQAVKIAEKQAKKNPNSITYKLNVGSVYEKVGRKDKAASYFEKIINDLDNNTTYVQYKLLGNEFTKLNKLNYALEVYKKGDKNIKNTNLNFGIYIADLYGRKNMHEEMIDAYLAILSKNPGQLSRVQSVLPRTIDFEEDNAKCELLRVKLLKKIQSEPSNIVFNRMLIWFFQQRGEFRSAFIQVKALDKRKKAKGEEVYRFANLCTSNKEYNLAIDGYEYILSNFSNENYYYKSSEKKILGVLNEKITTNNSYNDNDLSKLESRYVATLGNVKNYREKVPLIMDLAKLEIYYIHNLDTARILLDEVLAYPGLDKKSIALAKTLKADLLLIENEVWDASLLYMQVEKMFKQDVIGHTAKFKNARLYYFTGDYEWSQNQLNSLKASTSKLISNDAMDLSLLITDNYNMDTTVVHMNRFSQADLLILQNKYQEALTKLDSINMEAPAHSLNDEILYKRYEIAFKKREFIKAEEFLNEIVKTYSEDILADNALFKLGELYENQLKDEKKAFQTYGKLLFDYPGSLFVVEARKRYRAYKEQFGVTDDSINTINQ